jgi:DNA-binding protein YbaB
VGELDGAHQWLDDYTRRVAEIQQRAEQVQTDIKSMRARATSPDGTVSVVLAPGGRLESLDLTPQALQAGHQRLAQIIADTVRAAHDDAAAQTQAALQPLVGDSPAMEFLRDQIETAQHDDPATSNGTEQRPARRPGNDDDDESPYGGSIMR